MELVLLDSSYLQKVVSLHSIFVHLECFISSKPKERENKVQKAIGRMGGLIRPQIFHQRSQRVEDKG